MTFFNKWQYFCQSAEKIMIKNIFKNNSKMTTENKENEEVLDQPIAENHEQGIESAEALSPEQKLEEDLANEKDKFLRLFAEFENYKRRTAKERLDLFKTANQEVLQAILPVMDDFDRALTEIKKTVNNKLVGVLTKGNAPIQR